MISANASFWRARRTSANPHLTRTHSRHNATMDRQSVYTLSLFGENESANGGESNRKIHKELVDFILEFHLENVYIYR